jgi:glutathione synthase
MLLNFQDVCPPIKLCHSVEEILEFANYHELVLKPLKEYGGKGILRLNKHELQDGDKKYDSETYLKSIETYIQKEGFLAMKFLKNVKQGDKRLIVVDGDIMAASLRMPADGSWLCNVAMGGTSVKTVPDDREIQIIERINPYLKENGILMYGADTLVDDNGDRILSEINTLSIGGFPQAEMQTKRPIIKITIDKIFKYADVQLAG